MKTMTIKKSLSALLAAVFCISISSCRYEDTVATLGNLDISQLINTDYSVSGMILDENGIPVSGVKVEAHSEGAYVNVTSSDANGVYQMTLTKKTTYTLKATKEHYDDVSIDLVMPEEEKMLAYDIHMQSDGTIINPNDPNQPTDPDDPTNPDNPTQPKDYIISPDMTLEEGTSNIYKASLTTHTLKGDNPLANIKVELTMETNTPIVANDDKKYLRAVYTKTEAQAAIDIAPTTPLSSELFCSVYFTSNGDTDFATASNNCITFNLDSEFAGNATVMRNIDGSWEPVPSTAYNRQGSKINIVPQADGIYALCMTVTAGTPTTEQTDAVKAYWENRHENTTMYLDYAEYQYKVGVGYDIEKGNTVTQALLLEHLYRTYGYTATDKTGQYDMDNYGLMPGFCILLTGKQTVYRSPYSTTGATINKTTYGNVGFNIQGFTVDHEGGIF